MKILLLTTHLDFGGISIYCVSLAKALKEMGHEVAVSSSGGVLTSELKAAGIGHIQLNIRTKSELSPLVWKAYKKLEVIFKTQRPDIIHVHTRVTQAVACMIYKKTGIPYLSTCHGFFRPHLGRKMFGFWGKKVIAISEAVREHLVNDLKAKKETIALIHNGIDVKKFQAVVSEKQKSAYRSRLGIKNGPVVGIIARLSPVKGHRFLLGAMKEVLKKYPHAQLLIIGDGPQKRNLIELTIGLGLGKCTFIEESTMDTRLALSVMDIFVLPSIQEGLGLSAMEAMVAGVPVIGSNVGGVYSLIKDGQTGILVPPQDPLALAAAIIRLLDDKGLGLNMANAARELIKEKFSLEDMAKKVERLYKEAIEENAKDKNKKTKKEQ
jgi:glycosyltransferase involved in cell wall biosynthesis